MLGPAIAASFGGGQPSALQQQQQHSLHRVVASAAASLSWRPDAGGGCGGSGATCPGGELALMLLLLVASPWQPLLGRRYISSSTSLTRLLGETGCGSVVSSVDDLLTQQRLRSTINNNNYISTVAALHHGAPDQMT